MGNVQTTPPTTSAKQEVDNPVPLDRHGIPMSQVEIDHCRNYYKDWIACLEQNQRSNRCDQQRAHLFGICADQLIKQLDQQHKVTIDRALGKRA